MAGLSRREAPKAPPQDGRVHDIDRAVEMTADLGGAVASGPMTTRHGRFAILEDPGSAMFAVFEPITH